MSNLQKSLFQKKKGIAFGLDLLSEDPTDLIEAEDAETESSRDDSLIKELYDVTRSLTFPVQETYTDPRSGVTFQTYYSPPPTPTSPILVCHHGAGSSGMTFCCLTRYVTAEWPGDKPGVFTFDARGHGNSSTPEPVDYSLQAFTDDFQFILLEFHARHKPENTLCLVGHSLGGSVLTNYITKATNEFAIKGLVVIDIVEETAVRALLSVSQFLSRRPKSFRNYGEAVLWHILSHLLRNEESARVSVVDLLEVELPGRLVWRADLALMEKFWDTWFVNLSDNFITCGAKTKLKIGKLLILSGNEILDKNLIIGQMQGKYQLIVFNNTTNTGHFLQEDIPKQLGISIMEFVRRNDTRAAREQETTVEPRWGGKINQ